MGNWRTDDWGVYDYTDNTKLLILDLSGLPTGASTPLYIDPAGATGTLIPAFTNAPQAWSERPDFQSGILLSGGDTPVVFSLSGQQSELRAVNPMTGDWIWLIPDHSGTLVMGDAAETISEAWLFTSAPTFSANVGSSGQLCILQDSASGKSLFLVTNGAISADADLILPALGGTVICSSVAITSGRVVVATTGGRVLGDSDMTFSTDTLTVTKLVIGTSLTTVGGTAPVADGTYTVGNRITPITGNLGTITTKSGIITAVQQAT